jgi:hypothetical protein
MFLGFCGWALVKFDRLLLHGIPELGALRYGDRVFTFSSIQVDRDRVMVELGSGFGLGIPELGALRYGNRVFPFIIFNQF